MKKLLSVVLFLLLCATLPAINIKHFDKDAGLSSNRTFSIAKDDIGFIWIGTKNGIDRFDGRSFKSYPLCDLEDPQIELNGRINKVLKDKDGNLWAYTNFGAVFLYNSKSDAFELKVDLTKQLPEIQPYVNGIYPINRSQLIVCGSFGLCFVDTRKEKIMRPELFQNCNIWTIEPFEDNLILIASRDESYIVQIESRDNTLYIVRKAVLTIPERIVCLCRNPFKEELILGTFDGKLIRMQLKDYSYELTDLGINCPVRSISCVENHLYITTENVGLLSIPLNFKKNANEIVFLNSQYQIDAMSMYQALFEKNGTWISSTNQGIFYVDNNLPEFQFMRFPENKVKSWGAVVNAITEDLKGNIWLGTPNGIVRHGKQWDFFPISGGGQLNERFNTITLCCDPSGKIWAGGLLGAKLVTLNSENVTVNQITVLPNSKENPHSGRIYTICYDQISNSILAGGLHCMLSRINLSNYRLEDLKLNHVNHILRYGSSLLISTTMGITQFDDRTGEIRNIYFNPKVSPLGRFVNLTHVDKQSNIWVGTEGGLYQLNRDFKQIKHYSKQTGLPSNSIYGLLSDQRNRLWIISEKALTCLTPSTGEIVNYDAEEGLQASQFLARSFYQTANGDILFGTNSGYIRFSPEKMDKIESFSKLIFTDLIVEYQKVLPSQQNSPLTDIIDNTEEIRLNHNQNTFSIHFSSINFTNPKSEIFEWKLDGFDAQWIRTDSHNTQAHFTNVPSGNYTFKVRLLNKDNGNVIAERNLSVVVSPPFWATTWAFLLYGAIAFFIARLLVQRVKERVEQQNTLDKINFFTHTAHELKTPITLVKGPLTKLSEIFSGTETERQLIDLSLNNTLKLHSTVTQLLDFEKMEAQGIKLYLEPKELIAYFNTQLSRFASLAANKNIQLKFKALSPEIKAWIDEEKMDKIISNLVTNSIKYTPTGGNVEMIFSTNADCWSLEVKDNGIGIPSRFQKKIFKPFSRAFNASLTKESGTGLGLAITKRLILLHSGNITFSSTEGNGCSFVITVPINYTQMNHGNYLLSTNISEQQDPTLQATTKTADEDENKRAHLLIVEDNQEVREFIKLILSDKFDVSTAEDGLQGLEFLKHKTPELIISDVMMPNMDGYEFCHQVKSNRSTSHIPIILLTALSGNNHQLKGYRLGADNYIAKPFDNQMLLMTVENTITTRQALRNNLLSRLSPSDTPEQFETDPLEQQFIDEITSLIESKINDASFTIEWLCREMAMSRTSLYNKLKQLTGQSPNEFIRYYRLTQASTLLSSGRYTVSEVAYRVGVGDEKYFSTIFKKQYGVSPSKYKGK